MSTTNKTVLIIGPGFIGWNVLDILVAEGYSVTGFVRRKEHGDDIKASGAESVVLGDLDDKRLITEEVMKHDIVFHTATADHLPSVEAVLEGLRKRAEGGRESIFIHTSGTSVLEDNSMGAYKGDKIYRDDRPEDIDAVPDSAIHRKIDLAIVKARKDLSKAKVAIVIPPTIYGWTHGRGTIQLPYLARFALKHHFVPTIGPGLAVESNIHVLDLARAYVTIFHFLESESAASAKLANPYWFCEATGDDEPSWYDIAAHIAASMRDAGKTEVEEKPRVLEGEEGKKYWGDLFGDVTPSIIGLNSRSRAVRLRELGWEAREKGWRESWVQDELPHIPKGYGKA